MARSICLITPGHLASTPRVVKEADALTEAGYAVHLVASSHYALVEPLDAAVLARAKWPATRVRTLAGPGALVNRFRRRWLQHSRPAPERLTLAQAELLVCPGLGRLVRAAVATGAEFFHGHCLAGLAVAAQAARQRGVSYGFDAEDYHPAETVELETDPFQQAVVRRVLDAYLAKAKVRTAAAPFIAAEFERTHGVAMTVVLNAFPLRDAPARPAPPREFSTAAPARFYWFSQTIGPGRGLERMVDVLTAMQTPACLHLRGSVTADYVAELRARAARAGRGDSVQFLPPGPPDEMVRLAAEADVGLSLEETRPRNRDVCLTNKIFVYLLAGLPQVLSQTTAQAAFARELGDAGRLADFTDVAGTARQLDNWLADAGLQRAARDAAWRLGRERFCWEREQAKLLAAMKFGGATA